MGNLQLIKGIKDNTINFLKYENKPVDMHIKQFGRIQLQKDKEIFGTHELQFQTVNT